MEKENLKEKKRGIKYLIPDLIVLFYSFVSLIISIVALMLVLKTNHLI